MNPTTAVDRRRFLQGGLTLGSAAMLSGGWSALAQSSSGGASGRWSAAVIGHTGRGDYGHGLDVIFNGHPDVQVRAVADPDATGRAQAQDRCHAERSYADYQELLAKEKPQLVAVGPRHSDQHHAIVSAALKSGAHVIVEKPFTQDLVEADDLNALAQARELRIVVAHQMRLSPSIRNLKSKLDDGLIGRVISINAHGKQDDRRAGGEDLIVLGTHLFDLMRYLAGDVAAVTAQIWQRGREAMKSDARTAGEAIGPVLGDEIEAQFQFISGITGTFRSRAGLRETLGPWGLTLLGDKGVVRILWDIDPRILLRQTVIWNAGSGTEQWVGIPGDPAKSLSAEQRGFPAANRRVLDDWLQAIREKRAPACSGLDGAKALEMALGIFQAGLERGRVRFPLTRRKHPLAA